MSVAHIRDSNNVAHSIRNLRIVVHDMNSTQLPAALLSQKLLSEVVSEALPQYTSGADLLPKNIISVGNHDLQLNGELFTLNFWIFLIYLFSCCNCSECYQTQSQVTTKFIVSLTKHNQMELFIAAGDAIMFGCMD